MKHKSKREERGDEHEIITDETPDLSTEEELIVASVKPDPSGPTEASEDASLEAEPAPAVNISEEDQKPEKEEKKHRLIRQKKEKPADGEEPVKDEAPQKEEKPKKEKPKKEKPAVKPHTEEETASGRIAPVPDGNLSLPGPLLIIRLIAAVVLMILPRFLDVSDGVIPFMYIAAAVISGYDIAIAAVRDVIAHIYLRENLPLLIAAICSFAIGRGWEGALAIVLLQVAYIVRGVIVRKTKSTLLDGISMPPPSKGISVGDSITINEGTRVPTDCSVVDGRGMVDCSFITGDISPIQFRSGDFIPAGCICLSGQMMLRAETLPEASVSAKICRTLEHGYKTMTETEKKATSIGRYVTPILLLISLVLLILLPFSYDYPFADALRRVVAIIAISSPCAALLSVPMSYLSALTSARRAGTVFRDASVLDKTATVRSVVLDKAGTVTNDTYVVTDISSERMDPKTFLKVAAHVAAISNRPLAKAIVAAYGDAIDFSLVRDYIEYRDRGISVVFDGIKVILGNSSFAAENGVTIPNEGFDGTAVYMAIQGEYAGRIVLKDSVNTSIQETVRELHSAGVDRVAMISSDGRERDSAVAREAGINEYYAECSQEEKARRIKDIRSHMPGDSSIAYVVCGDRCEQACRTADIAVVMRGMENRFSGGDADAVVMGRSIKSIPDAVFRAKKVRRTVGIKFIIALLIKALMVILAAAGYVPLWFAIFLDNCASLALIIDYSELFRPKGRASESPENI